MMVDGEIIAFSGIAACCACAVSGQTVADRQAR
jgi:hypothetical protein